MRTELIAKNMLHPRELPDKFDIEIKAKAQIDTGDLNIQSVPGDKSISQRAIILNALSDGTGKIKRVLKSRDIYSCIRALSQLGVPIRWEGDTLIVEGVGLNGLIGPENRVYMDNTATSTRIIMSILAGSPLKLGISGNSLLSNRPMKWVTSHLIKMGANITFLEKRHYLPLIIEGRYPLNPVTVEATVASAQEKSAVLFAGMFADGYTKYKQFCQSRDHTERMMKYFGLPL